MGATNEVCSPSSEEDLPTDLDRSAPWRIRWPAVKKGSEGEREITVEERDAKAHPLNISEPFDDEHQSVLAVSHPSQQEDHLGNVVFFLRYPVSLRERRDRDIASESLRRGLRRVVESSPSRDCTLYSTEGGP